MSGPEDRELQWQALANLLHAELEKRGWDQTRLVAESGLGNATVSRFLNARGNKGANTKDNQIRLSTLVALSETLDIGLAQILETLGYELEPPSDPNEADLRFAQHLARQLDVFPELRPIVGWLFDLDDSDRRAVVLYLTLLRKQRGDQM